MFSSVLITTLEGHVSWSKCNFFGRELGGMEDGVGGGGQEAAAARASLSDIV